MAKRKEPADRQRKKQEATSGGDRTRQDGNRLAGSATRAGEEGEVASEAQITAAVEAEESSKEGRRPSVIPTTTAVRPRAASPRRISPASWASPPNRASRPVMSRSKLSARPPLRCPPAG